MGWIKVKLNFSTEKDVVLWECTVLTNAVSPIAFPHEGKIRCSLMCVLKAPNVHLLCI